jgi:hypothetical protein
MKINSIDGFLANSASVCDTISPSDFFDRFNKETFELGIEIVNGKGELELDFITMPYKELMLFCSIHQIKQITYFGEDEKFIVRLSRK